MFIVELLESDPAFSNLAFHFFFCFSRFEFALKERRFLDSHKIGAAAKPGWAEFVNKYHSSYVTSSEAKELLIAPPKKQFVGNNDELTWEDLNLDKCNSDLEKVVSILRTIRNNLFHGGKHGLTGWNDHERTSKLLIHGMETLGQLASFASINAEYSGKY